MFLNNSLLSGMMQNFFIECGIMPDSERKRPAMKISCNNYGEARLAGRGSRWVASPPAQVTTFITVSPGDLLSGAVTTEHTGFIAAGC